MKQNLKTTQITKMALIVSICLSLSLFGIFSVSKAEAKPAPLSLADVLTGLRSPKTSLAQRNKLLTAAVKERGITFSLTPEIEKELKTAGANATLLDAIRQKSPNNPTQNAKPSGVMNSFRVDYDIESGGRWGMMIYPNFTVTNLKNVKSQFVIFVETANGTRIKAVTNEYASTNGDLIVGSFLNPRSQTETYNSKYFLPYDEINVGRGKHPLRLNVRLIYDNGTTITNFGYENFTLRVG